MLILLSVINLITEHNNSAFRKLLFTNKKICCKINCKINSTRAADRLFLSKIQYSIAYIFDKTIVLE